LPSWPPAMIIMPAATNSKPGESPAIEQDSASHHWPTAQHNPPVQTESRLTILIACRATTLGNRDDEV
jgi:hypothetical protein